MKKSILLPLFLCISVCCFSQTFIDIVYLKDGSMIKGQIIEQVPHQYLKVQTYDGSIFVYKMDQVELIQKENISSKDKCPTNKKYSLRGYKGFVDAGLIFGDYMGIETSTSHGFQINNHFYIGGGLALNVFQDIDYAASPVFLNLRANLLNKKITPFGDFKLGYSAGDIEGVYVSLGAGVRFALKNKKALYLKVAYSFQDNDLYYYPGYGNSYQNIKLEGCGIKFGFEF